MVVLCDNLDFCAGSPYIHFDNILLSRFGDEILKLALILTKAMFGISHPTRTSKYLYVKVLFTFIIYTQQKGKQPKVKF